MPGPIDDHSVRRFYGRWGFADLPFDPRRAMFLRMIDIEPAQVIKRLSRVIPLMRDRLERLAMGPDAALAVATAVRVAVSHYLVRSDDHDEFLAQLRHAAGVKAP